MMIKKTKMETNRFYFNKNKLIKWIGNNNKDLSVSAQNFADKESELCLEALMLIKQLEEE